MPPEQSAASCWKQPPWKCLADGSVGDRRRENSLHRPILSIAILAWGQYRLGVNGVLLQGSLTPPRCDSGNPLELLLGGTPWAIFASCGPRCGCGPRCTVTAVALATTRCSPKRLLNQERSDLIDGRVPMGGREPGNPEAMRLSRSEVAKPWLLHLWALLAAGWSRSQLQYFEGVGLRNWPYDCTFFWKNWYYDLCTYL